jgi:hypothetical protein
MAGRSESARRAAQARWSKAAHATPALDTSKKALHTCLKRIKGAKNEKELRRLTEVLQSIVFHRQYKNAENSEAAAVPAMLRSSSTTTYEYPAEFHATIEEVTAS